MTLDELLVSARSLPGDLPLVFATDEGPIGAGYHVTELKLANIVSIDCGARTSSWSESTLQLLDGQGRDHMSVGKFATILDQSLRKVAGLGASPVLVEFAHRNAGMQIFRPTEPERGQTSVTLRLEAVRAQCKPAQQARLEAQAATANAATSASCCA